MSSSLYHADPAVRSAETPQRRVLPPSATTICPGDERGVVGAPWLGRRRMRPWNAEQRQRPGHPHPPHRRGPAGTAPGRHRQAFPAPACHRQGASTHPPGRGRRGATTRGRAADSDERRPRRPRLGARRRRGSHPAPARPLRRLTVRPGRRTSTAVAAACTTRPPRPGGPPSRASYPAASCAQRSSVPRRGHCLPPAPATCASTPAPGSPTLPPAASPRQRRSRSLPNGRITPPRPGASTRRAPGSRSCGRGPDDRTGPRLVPAIKGRLTRKGVRQALSAAHS